MTKQYRVYFLSAESIILNEAEFAAFVEARKTPLYDVNRNIIDVVEWTTDGRFYSITRSNITHILSENIENESQVVTPPTPTQLRAEREQDQANQPVTLEDQLANPEVAK